MKEGLTYLGKTSNGFHYYRRVRKGEPIKAVAFSFSEKDSHDVKKQMIASEEIMKLHGIDNFLFPNQMGWDDLIYPYHMWLWLKTTLLKILNYLQGDCKH